MTRLPKTGIAPERHTLRERENRQRESRRYAAKARWWLICIRYLRPDSCRVVLTMQNRLQFAGGAEHHVRCREPSRRGLSARCYHFDDLLTETRKCRVVHDH